MVVAYTAVPLLVSLAPFSLTGIADIAVDGRVLAFTLCISIVTAVLFAWAPVFETSRVSLLSTLGGTTPTATAGSVRTQGLLISFEVALAVLLLTAAGLMVKSLWHLQMYPEGFTPRGTYTMRVPLSGPRYEDLGQKHAYVNELLQRLESTPGVEAAGIASVTYNIPVAVSGVGRGDAGVATGGCGSDGVACIPSCDGRVAGSRALAHVPQTHTNPSSSTRRSPGV